MADVKISALPAATTPLAGTEVLPLVQSSTTKKVATDDLTVKNVRSNATTGILQIAGPAAGTTRTMTTPNANFTAARTDAAQSFTGDQTLSTGNLIQGTSAKGINFTANSAAAGKTSQLLNYYEEGTWTPTYEPTTGAFTTLTVSTLGARYVKVGRLVVCKCLIRTSEVVVGTAAGSLKIAGLPFTAAANDFGGVIDVGTSLGFNTNNPTGGYVDGNVVYLYYRATANGESQALTVAHMTTGASANKNYIICTITYEAT